MQVLLLLLTDILSGRWGKKTACRLEEFKVWTHLWTRGGVKPGKSPLEGGANFFTAERDRKHTAKKDSRGLGMDMSPEGWTGTGFSTLCLT